MKYPQPSALFLATFFSRSQNFILAVRELMFERNPYHNWYHVVDVTQCVFALAHKVQPPTTVGGGISLFPPVQCEMAPRLA